MYLVVGWECGPRKERSIFHVYTSYYPIFKFYFILISFFTKKKEKKKNQKKAKKPQPNLPFDFCVSLSKESGRRVVASVESHVTASVR